MDEKQRQILELNTLTWMLETFDPKKEGTSRRCKNCRMRWFGIGIASSLLLLVSYMFDVDIPFLLIFSALAGASFMASSLMTESALMMQTVARFVDLKSAKERLDEIRKLPPPAVRPDWPD